MKKVLIFSLLCLVLCTQNTKAEFPDLSHLPLQGKDPLQQAAALLLLGNTDKPFKIKAASPYIFRFYSSSKLSSLIDLQKRNFAEILKQAGAPRISSIMKALDTNKLNFSYNGSYYTLKNDEGKTSTFKITTVQPLPNLSHLPLHANEPLQQTAALLLLGNTNKSFKLNAPGRYIFSFYDIKDSPITLSKLTFGTMLKHAGAPGIANIKRALETGKLILGYNGISYTLTDEIGRISHFNIENIKPLVAPLDTFKKAAEVIALADIFQRIHAEHKEKERVGEQKPYPLMDIQIAGKAYKLGVQESEVSSFQKLRNHLNTPNGITAEIAEELLINGQLSIRRGSDDIAVTVEHNAGITLHLLLTKADNPEKVKDATNYLRKYKVIQINGDTNLKILTSGSQQDRRLSVFFDNANMLFKKTNDKRPFAAEEIDPESTRWKAFLEALPKNYISTLSLRGLKPNLAQLAELAAVLPQIQGLRSLFLNSNNFGAAEMEILAPAFINMPELETLDLSNNQLDAGAMQAFAPDLAQMQALHSLDLSNNQLDAGAMQDLVPALVKMNQLSSLTLSNNPLTADGITVLFRDLDKINNLQSLSISEIQIDEGDIQAMGAALEAAIEARPDMPLSFFYMYAYPNSVMLDLIPPLLKLPNLNDDDKRRLEHFLNEQEWRVQNRKPVPYDEDEDDADIEEYLREVE